MMNKDNIRLESEDYEAYAARLLRASYRAGEAVKVHERWKRRLTMGSGVREPDCRRRVLVVLRELLESDFLLSDYIDTGFPREDCRQAKKELESLGFSELLEIKGAEWKYALLSQHLRRPGEQRVLTDAAKAGFYIDEMHERLSDEAVESFLWFATMTRLAYEEIDRLKSNATLGEKNEASRLTPQQQAVKAFVDKIVRLGNAAYEAYNGKRVSPGVHQPEAEIVIRKDELAQHMQQKMRDNFDELLTLCYPEDARSKQRLCQYVLMLMERKGYFGKLPKNLLALLLAPIAGLKEGTAKGYLSKKKPHKTI